MPCAICDDTGWVCEAHKDRPWDGVSARSDACGCGAGAPCVACNPNGDIDRVMVEIICSRDEELPQPETGPTIH